MNGEREIEFEKALKELRKTYERIINLFELPSSLGVLKKAIEEDYKNLEDDLRILQSLFKKIKTQI